MQHKTLWGRSAIVSAILVAILLILWMQLNEHAVEPTLLVNEESTLELLQEYWEDSAAADLGLIEPPRKIKTGIYIQSLEFFNSSYVNLTGYIWQRYRNGVDDDLKPAHGEVGFILPDRVNSGFKLQETYRKSVPGEEVIGWYFEARLRQPFAYATYPFDHKIVSVRMRHKQFSRYIVLVPDFEAYVSTGLHDVFGIDQEVTLSTWRRENTFFDYKITDNDTNFGTTNFIGRHSFPELHYNFVILRKFESALIVNLLPLFLVATLLFVALLTITKKGELADRLGFNVLGFIGVASALFFVVMLAHIQLRKQFAGSGIVYIEYFYILMYLLLVLATANACICSLKPKRRFGMIMYGGNILVKVGYWPFVLACLIAITFGVL